MNSKTIIENQTFDLERSLYHLQDSHVLNCTFAGIRDGESVLKEARNIIVENCEFSLRYPLWHVENYQMLHCHLDEKTRAPIWYSKEGLIDDCKITGIKVLRECQDTKVIHSHIDSPEFGWKCKRIEIEHSTINSEYMMLDSEDVTIDHLTFSGKYSFQYIKNLKISNSIFDTKDAFWHSENIIVSDSVLKGEYLAWFSKNLTLIRCKIIGTQPFCYCENLKLIDCEMVDTDLSFEYSSVDASIIGHVDSIKNPKSGTIIVDSVGEVIYEDAIMETLGKVEIRK